ncbi:MAG: oligosaccharide flippase family protein, partial [Anaerolineae bacterium]|nr:oligosaccharide flippase family protein [Anaerolineae bacterium]
MKPSRIAWMQRLTPSQYLALMNVASAGIGFLAGVYTARVLGANRLGVTAVIAGINTSIVSLVDVRFNDVAAKAFYQVGELPPERMNAYRAGVVWLAALATGLLAGAVAALSILIGSLLVPIFTETPVAGWWLPADALALALNTVAGTLTFMLRFSGAFYVIGTWRLITQAIHSSITVLVLTLVPNINGMYLAVLMGGTSNLLMATAISWGIWGRRVRLPMRHPDLRRACAEYRRSLSMVFYGNLLGYAKLLQRNADVLLVAYFTTDRETGIYKLARSLIDQGLAVLQDALYQVYYP